MHKPNGKTMGKVIVSIYTALASLFFLACPRVAVHAQEPKAVFNQQQIVSLSGPAVVRIVQHVQGEAVFPPFRIDLQTMSIGSEEGIAHRIPVDEYSVGSGFVVSEGGDIVTNSHVVSVRQTKLEIVSMVAQRAVMSAIAAYGIPEDSTQGSDTQDYEEYAKRIKEYLLQGAQFDLQSDVAVLDPSSKETKLPDMVAAGFPARIIVASETYDEDGIDVAMIKIEQGDLPTVPLGQSAAVRVGERIGVFGFPSTGDFSGNNPLIPTFSQGVISAIKRSQQGNFDLMQADAKISEGSSGGPLLGESGEVIGIVTYQSTRSDGESGDNFAFAIPIDVARETLERLDGGSGQVTFVNGKYNTFLARGIALLGASKCRLALTDFETATGGTNEKFSVSQNVQPYIEQCQAMVAEGQSIDNQWDRTKQLMTLIGWRTWIGVAIVLGIIVLVSWKLVSMKRRLKKDEREMRLIEREMGKMARRERQEVRHIHRLERKVDDMEKRKKMMF